MTGVPSPIGPDADGSVTTYAADWAWLPAGCTPDVRIAVAGGRVQAVSTSATPQLGDEHLVGLVLPGLANTHSHAFHRALRGRTHSVAGRESSFWTWREAMYEVAARLTPDTYLALARAVFGEMLLGGVTTVGEFHYLHHRPDGRRYDDPNAMGRALLEAAAAAGLRVTLLDACYLVGGFGPGGYARLEGTQRRFGDGDAAAWAARVDALSDTPSARIGAAIHSVRAVPAAQLPVVVEASRGRPLHVHLSEQPAENQQCLAATGLTPTGLLDRAGVLGPATTAVHATHLSEDDIARLGRSGTSISVCPTTERDLADGIGPGRALADAGSRLTLGSDQNAMIDLFEEARALEMDERLASGERTRFAPEELVAALTGAGQAALGWPDAGRIELGARADLVSVRLDSVRTAGTDPDQALLAATASDVETVVVDGRVVVRGGRHLGMDVAAELRSALAALRG
ncbi:MAG: formimidoylglutamate deiminase [bacterium]